MIYRAAELYRATSSERAIVALLAANAIPIVGVLFLGWSLHTILVLYWLENGIVGLWNVPKIALAQGPLVPQPGILGGTEPAGQLPTVTRSMASEVGQLAKVAIIPFFLFHYGMFWLVHGVFVFVLPEFASLSGGSDAFGGIRWSAVLLGGVAMFLSHGASFAFNYLGRGEYRTASPGRQMGSVYGRVVILHLTILFGAFAVGFLGAPIVALLILVVLKSVLDLGLHLREHRRMPAPTTTGTAMPQPASDLSTNLP